MAAFETSNTNLYPLLLRALAFFCRRFSLDGVKPRRSTRAGVPSARLAGVVRVTLRPGSVSLKVSPVKPGDKLLYTNSESPLCRIRQTRAPPADSLLEPFTWSALQSATSKTFPSEPCAFSKRSASSPARTPARLRSCSIITQSKSAPPAITSTMS